MKPLLLCLAIAGLTSCGGDHERSTAAPVTETKKASLGKAEMLSAEVHMAAGELEVRGVEGDEVAAEFYYTPGSFTPEFRFDNTTFRARATIGHTNREMSGINMKENRWRVQLPNRAATDLQVHMGAGEARLTLGTIDLRKVELHLGAGKVVADFLGTPKRDYEVQIAGGVGECEVIVPKEAGIRAEAHGGLGSIDVTGLEKYGDHWENASFKDAKTKIRLDVRGGIGRISIAAR